MDKYLENYSFKPIDIWQTEGYCESIYYADTVNLHSAKDFIIAHERSDRSRNTLYKEYYFAITYLRDVKKMNFEEILNSDLSFNQILEEIKNEKEQ